MAKISFPDITTWSFSDSLKLELFGNGAALYAMHLKNVNLTIDDFSSGNLSNWSFLPNTTGTARPNVFTNSAGKMSCDDSVNQSGPMPVAVTSSYNNTTDSTWTVQFEFSQPLEGDNAYICFGADTGSTPAQNCYKLMIRGNANQFLFYKCVANSNTQLGATQSVTINNSTTYTFQVVKTATNMQVWFNGTKMIDVADTTYTYLRRIGVHPGGVYAAASKFYIDNITVTTTSTFASDSPTADTSWLAINTTAINGVKFFENISIGTGNLKYQYAVNSGSLNGSWLTLAQLQTALASVTITDVYNSIKFRVQFNGNGSQQVECLPAYIICADSSINTAVIYINKSAGNMPIGSNWDSPAVFYMPLGYDSTQWTVTASDTAVGYLPQNVASGLETTTWRPNAPAGTHYLIMTAVSGVAYQCDSFALQGKGMAGMTVEFQGSNDGFVSDITSLWGPSVINNTANDITTYGLIAQTSKIAYRFVFTTVPNTSTEIAHALLSNRMLLPYLQTVNPDDASVTGIVNVTDGGLYAGSYVASKIQPVQLAMPDLYEAEYQAIYPWIYNCCLNLLPFFFVSTVSSNIIHYCYPSNSFNFKSPIDGNMAGMRRISGLNFNARLPG
jgi:hypothetical protein